MRRHRVLVMLWATAFVTIAALAFLLPPSDWTSLGPRDLRAGIIQTVLTGIALLAAVLAIFLGMGPAPVLRVHVANEAAMMRSHYVVSLSAGREAIVGLRVEIRLKPTASPRRLEYHALAREDSLRWLTAYEVDRHDPERGRVVGWDFEKDRLEPMEDSPDLYFALFAPAALEPPEAGDDAKVMEIRWWSRQAGPTRLEIPLAYERAGKRTFESRGS